MYFLFLGHYTTYLLPFGLAGLVVLADVLAESVENEGGLAYGLGNAKLIPIYGLFCALWGQVGNYLAGSSKFYAKWKIMFDFLHRFWRFILWRG